MDRLSPLDALFLSQDTPNEPRQIASLVVFEPDGSPLTFDGLLKVLNERLDIVPRYRQVPYRVPGGLGTPVWRDYPKFDIAHHVRRSALPKPGGRAELHELVGRLVARRLELDRPLWELYYIEGLDNGAEALLFKAHQALVDGSETIDLAQVLLEETARVRDIPHHEWKSRPEPSGLSLLAGTADQHLRHPAEVISTAGVALGRLRRALPLVGGNQSPPRGVLSATLSRHRRFSSLSTDLADYRTVRDGHGGTVNDVILASIAGGIRGWMLTRAERATAKTAFRAMVPMSVVSDEGLPTSLGSKVRGHLLSLPVGESNPVVRLHQVSYALKDHRDTGSAVAANKLASLPGFATSTFHAVGARVAEAEADRAHQIVITNVPGPQETVYMAGEPIAEVYPCIPLTENRTVSIGVTSYRGRVFYGITADREAVPDVDVLAQCIDDALAELVETVNTKSRAPRGRQRPQR
ncbi:MAG TPA: wax ester/triacylglycerol synthase family O-acyltransferase [Aeromicrobium sp.]|nr:wax ester/triacylglycerol synthase family O-acyltransferase [Aeromicrobium sp.]